jgi:hypothetical protein
MLARAAISWSSKKQPSVALSSTKAEYIASTHATKEAIWLQQLLRELWPDPIFYSPTTLLIDNQSAIMITRNLEFHDQTKHIEVCHHFLRQQFESKTIDLEYVPTDDQVADVLTKGLVRVKHDCFTAGMGVRRLG